MNRITPIDVKITHQPKPNVSVGGVDITQSVERAVVEFDGAEFYADIVVRADAQVDFPCHVTRVDTIDAGNMFEGLDAATINGWLSRVGMSSTPGDVLMAHLAEWVKARP